MRTYIPQDRIQSALKELDFHLDAKELDEICTRSGRVDEVDRDFFQMMLKRPSRLGEWAKSLQLHEIVADACPRKAGVDPLRVVSELSKDELITLMDAMRHGFERIIRSSLAKLKEAFLINDRKKNDGDSKFNVVAISCGDISDFHKGVEARIGIALLSFHKPQPGQ